MCAKLPLVVFIRYFFVASFFLLFMVEILSISAPTIAPDDWLVVKICLLKWQESWEVKENAWIPGEIWDAFHQADKIWAQAHIELVPVYEEVIASEEGTCNLAQPSKSILLKFVNRAPPGFGLAGNFTTWVGHPSQYPNSGYRFPGQLLAHEIGHIFDLPDTEDNSLMNSLLVAREGGLFLTEEQIKRARKFLIMNWEYFQLVVRTGP